MPIKHEPGEGQAKLNKLLKAIKEASVQVGWFETSKYPGTNTPVAYVAAIQEFGYAGKNIPPRPFMRPTITAKKQEWGALAKQFASGLLSGSETVESIMGKIGQAASGDFRAAIKAVSAPPLKLATVNARKAKLAKKLNYTPISLGKPLIDSAYMLNSLTYTVVVK